MSSSPFQINVRTLMGKPGDMRELTLEVDSPEQIGEGLQNVPKGASLGVDVRLESLHDGILATASVTAPTAGECSRCLTPIEEDLQVEFAELFAYARDEALEYEVLDDCVDLEAPIRDAVVLALPFNPVCQPDCLGLDPETGEKLTKPLQERTSEIDPRWAALLEFDASEPGDTPASE
ncbi:MAG: YceD family protein [Pseudoclavibacter sp.]